MTLDTTLPGGETLAATHRAMWALGDYALIAEEVMAPLGPILVAAAGIGPGVRVLDVAAGSGNISLPAARTGATVVSTDLTPELLRRSQTRAAMQGLPLTYREANAQALPFGDDEFDTVISAIGVMFAPDHRSAANELVRVCRPGGTIGLISWTLEGFFGQMLATIRPYRPSLSAVVPMSALWGREPYVSALLGNRVRGVNNAAGYVGGEQVRQRRGRPRLLQESLRPDDRGVRERRRKPGAGRRTRRPTHRARATAPGRRHHGMGVPARHRNQGVNRTNPESGAWGPVPTTYRPTYRRRGRRRAHRRRR